MLTCFSTAQAGCSIIILPPSGEGEALSPHGPANSKQNQAQTAVRQHSAQANQSYQPTQLLNAIVP